MPVSIILTIPCPPPTVWTKGKTWRWSTWYIWLFGKLQGGSHHSNRVHQLNPTDPFQSQGAYAHTHMHKHTHTNTIACLSVLYRAHSGLCGFHSVGQGKKSIQVTRLRLWEMKETRGGGQACWWTWMCARKGSFEGKSPIGMLIVSISLWWFWVSFFHWDAHKTVLWDRSLPAAPYGAFGREVSGGEKPSAQGFWKNHCFHWIKVQKENLD